jgi:repressor of nif and glnA expression
VATGLDVPRGQRGASVIGGVVLIAMLVVPSIARRLFPALRAPSSGRARRSQPDA